MKYKICEFTKSIPSCRNFVEGKQILQTDPIFFVEKKKRNDSSVSIIAYSLQTSNVEGDPHEIKGTLSNGAVEKILCMFKAASSQKYKHLVVTLLFLSIR